MCVYTDIAKAARLVASVDPRLKIRCPVAVSTFGKMLVIRGRDPWRQI